MKSITFDFWTHIRQMLRAISLVLSVSCKVTNLAWVPVFVTSCNHNYLNSHLRVLILEVAFQQINLGADFNLLVHPRQAAQYQNFYY